MTLPEGVAIYTHPRSKVRFVELPNRKLVPNVGGYPQNPKLATDEDLANNLRMFLIRERTS